MDLGRQECLAIGRYSKTKIVVLLLMSTILTLSRVIGARLELFAYKIVTRCDCYCWWLCLWLLFNVYVMMRVCKGKRKRKKERESFLRKKSKGERDCKAHWEAQYNRSWLGWMVLQAIKSKTKFFFTKDLFRAVKYEW